MLCSVQLRDFLEEGKKIVSRKCVKGKRVRREGIYTRGTAVTGEMSIEEGATCRDSIGSRRGSSARLEELEGDVVV